MIVTNLRVKMKKKLFIHFSDLIQGVLQYKEKMQIFVKNPKDSQELCLIEMQGDLESRLGSNVDVSGKFIGDLHYTKDGKTKFTAKANFS